MIKYNADYIDEMSAAKAFTVYIKLEYLCLRWCLEKPLNVRWLFVSCFFFFFFFFFLQQMAVKGTSAGTSADLLLKCVCVCVNVYAHLNMCSLLVHLRHLTEVAAFRPTSGGRGQVEAANEGDRIPERGD